MAFKTKAKNRQIIDDRQTLDAKHNNILQGFNDNKDNISELYNELEKIKDILNNLNIQNAKSHILNMDLQKQIWDIDDKKKLLEEQIYKIENNIDENAYMLKTGKLINNYYRIIDDEKKYASVSVVNDSRNIINLQPLDNNTIDNNNTINNNTIHIDTLEKTLEIDDHNTINNNTINNNIKKKTIIDWFQPNSMSMSIPISDNNFDLEKKKNPIQNPIQKKKTAFKFKEDVQKYDDSNNTNNNRNSKGNSNIIQNKDIIYEKFMKLIDRNYVNVNNDEIDIFDSCSKCSIEMLLNNNTGQLICPTCGMMENIIVDSDKPSFKDPPKEMTSFCYKRINHLNEFLAQFQAKETTDIPEDVYNEIIMEIKKERINNMVLITPEKMRILLKKIKKNDYYEHIPYIINQLNGLPAPVIAPEIEEIIRGMFKAIQIPFEKYCPQKRKNFLSYNYVMYKFFELLELDEYLNCFQLLKSRTKLHQQDEIWKNICKDLNWEFIKSL
uniref:Viral late gene transcription factor 3 zinc ribbon domain-containing protein n=1 Tax=viral metagenome TaxID=1070528 RepID=A0A6C0F140_9ZZZZ